MPALNKRLICVAEMLEKGRVVADIGTDHAFLPIYLVRSGISPKVIACDIAEKPLSVARQNIEKRQLQSRIILRLAPGLEAVNPEECTAVTITGMGGDTIAQIIAAAGWLKNSAYQLVLQPMSSAERLRAYLDSNGFNILAERAVLSQGRVYTVLEVRYTGKKAAEQVSYIYIGKLAQNTDPLSKTLIVRELKRLEKCATSLKNVARKQAEYFLYLKAAKEIKILLETNFKDVE